MKIFIAGSSNNTILFSDYERHFANIQDTLAELIKEINDSLGVISLSPVITGSGGLQLSKHLDLPFVQEVISVSKAADSIERYAKNLKNKRSGGHTVLPILCVP